MTADVAIHRAVLLQRIGVLEVRVRDQEQELAELRHEKQVMQREIDRWRKGHQR